MNNSVLVCVSEWCNWFDRARKKNHLAWIMAERGSAAVQFDPVRERKTNKSKHSRFCRLFASSLCWHNGRWSRCRSLHKTLRPHKHSSHWSRSRNGKSSLEWTKREQNDSGKYPNDAWIIVIWMKTETHSQKFLSRSFTLLFLFEF